MVKIPILNRELNINFSKPQQKNLTYYDVTNGVLGTGLNSRGVSGSNYDITANKYGAATAYSIIWYVRAVIDLYAMMSHDIPSEIVFNETADPANDAIVASSTDTRHQHLLYRVLSENRMQYGVNVIPAMIYQLMLYDMLFVEKIKNDFDYPRSFKILNTLGITINRNYGQQAHEQPIRSYSYSWNDGATTELYPHEVAYEHGFNPYDDLYGLSLIESVIDQLNIDRNMNRFLRAFFINDARPTLVGSPSTEFVNVAGGLGGLTDEQVMSLRKVLADDHRGVSNSWRPLIMSVPIEFQELSPPNMQDQSEFQESLQRQVMAAFGVNPALLGMTDKTNYKEGVEVRAQFVNDKLRPVLAQVSEVFNNHLLPFLTGTQNYRFRFRFDDYQLITEQDQTRSQLAIDRYTAGLITLNEAREYDNIETVDGGDVFSNGVSVDQLSTGVTELPDVEVIDTEESMLSVLPDGGATMQSWYQASYNTDDRLAELNAWRNFVINGTYKKRSFIPKALHGDYADDIQAVIDTAEHRRDITAKIDDIINDLIKAIQATRIDYELLVEDLIIQSRNREITRRQFTLRMMQGIRAYSKLAYIDGLQDGGVFGEPDDTEQAEIEKWVQAQRQYVRSLADVIYSDVGITDDEALKKPAMWYNKSISPMFDAGRASSDKNGMYEWVYGLAEHCKDCVTLNGQRHRMSTYYSKGILPQSDSLECNGFNCKCNLVRTNGRARGRLPKI